jgi:hypothetical protein
MVEDPVRGPLAARHRNFPKETDLAECTVCLLVESSQPQSTDMAGSVITFRYAVVFYGFRTDPADVWIVTDSVINCRCCYFSRLFFLGYLSGCTDLGSAIRASRSTSSASLISSTPAFGTASLTSSAWWASGLCLGLCNSFSRRHC